MAENMIPESVYEDHLTWAMSTGNYFIFNRDLVVLLGLDHKEALILQDMANLAGLSGVKKDKDKFFLCTSKFLEKTSAFPHATQTRLLTSLVEKGYVKLKKVGMPPQRWVRLNLVKLWDDVGKAKSLESAQSTRNESNDELETSRLMDSKRVTMNEPTNERTKRKGSQRSADSPEPPKNRRELVETDSTVEDYQAAANNLKACLRRYGRQVNKFNLKDWSTQFRLLETVDGVNFWEDFRWFIYHYSLDDEVNYRMPKISDADSYRKYHGWIHDAHVRAERMAQNLNS